MNEIDNGLTGRKCVPCEAGTPPLGKARIDELLGLVPAWSLLRFDDGTENHYFIEREFSFKDFEQALAFANAVGEIAEAESHHPDIFIHSWNKVRIDLSTHAIKGLSENDFILAAKIDAIQKRP